MLAMSDVILVAKRGKAAGNNSGTVAIIGGEPQSVWHRLRDALFVNTFWSFYKRDIFVAIACF